MEDAIQEMQPGCKFKLGVILPSFHIQCHNKIIKKAFGMLLKFSTEKLGQRSCPSQFHALKKIIRDLGFSYEKIDACMNDCMFCYSKNSNLTEYSTCKTSN